MGAHRRFSLWDKDGIFFQHPVCVYAGRSFFSFCGREGQEDDEILLKAQNEKRKVQNNNSKFKVIFILSFALLFCVFRFEFLTP